MKDDMLFSITVPGSTANLGPGFDSIGLAVNRYLTLQVCRNDAWEFVPMSDILAGIPTDKSNLIYEVAASVASDYGMELAPCKVHLYSDIPLSRGMGSSAAAIVAAIELADKLLDLNMTNKEKLRRASIYEGHPDNVAASLYGGLVIGIHDDEETELIHDIYPDVDLIAVIPDYKLKTTDSRRLLPDEFSYAEAVKASSVSNVLVASLLQNRWDLAGKMMMKDLFHQPYRKKVVPELEKAFSIVDDLNVYGASLSGAGPIVIFYTAVGNGESVIDEIKKHYPTHDVQLLQVDNQGVRYEMAPSTEQSMSK